MVTAESIILAIDSLNMDYLWQLALADPEGFIRKISIRQLGKKRILSLYSCIVGMDHDKLMSNKSFFLLVENLCVAELGLGMFSKKSNAKGSASSEKAQDPVNAVQKAEPTDPKKKKRSGESDDCSEVRQHVVNYLNEKTQKKFRSNTKETIQFINRLLKDGYTLDDFKKVINDRVGAWLDNPKMNVYLNPSTLFRPSNFEKYLNNQSSDPKRVNDKSKPNDKYEDFYL